ncbi:sugar ABC transporter substrate-binding protein [Streptomyces armeniacus]|uniref:Sugar ABC transporter substrate-binding protein n=1 Tax=Streptomyces armeniacus TaxID=83291 RepID=A0A345XQW8_9ACTN|nr:sugar ABC transporter substrate-binding protein [Streptomyces armeniacus]AXK34034.1 sugar ABC transporter substrate-binding protein [Streptomyces armeniacus]
MGLTRSRFLAALGAGGAALALNGCAESPAPLDVTGPALARDPRGTLRLWIRGGLLATGQRLVDSFHAAQDRIRIELTPVQDGQYVTKLATAIRGGREPDLVEMDDINSALFIHRGVFADLTPLINELPFREQLSPGHLAVGKRDGRYYAVPSLADNSALWCNRALLDRAKVDIDDATGSFEGCLEAARAVSALGRDTYGWYLSGNGAGALSFTVQPHIWAADTELVTGSVGSQRGNIEGNEPLRRTLAFLHTLWSERLMPRGAFSDDGIRWATDFHAGKVAMLPSGYGIVYPKAPRALRDDLDVRLLCGPDGGRAFFDGGSNYSLPNGSRNPSAAWEFIRFSLALKQQRALPETGYIPVRADAASPGFRAKYPLAVPPLDDMDAGHAPLTLAYNRIFNQSDGPWLAMIRRAVFGGEVGAAMREAQQGIDEILRQGDA